MITLENARTSTIKSSPAMAASMAEKTMRASGELAIERNAEALDKLRSKEKT